MVLQLNILESTSTKYALCQIWLKLAKWFWKNIWKFHQCIFTILKSFPLRKVGPFLLTELNPLHPRIICTKFGWNWPTGSGEDNFLKFVKVFLQFCNYLPYEKGGALYFPSPKDTLCQVWLKLAKWFWRRWKSEKWQQQRQCKTDKLWSEKLTWASRVGELKKRQVRVAK